MAEIVIPMAQYESSNEGSGNEGSSDSYHSPSPPDPLCAKRQRASSTDDLDYIPEEAIYDYYKLHVIIYTIVVF
jgi:hypothetical protein